MIHSLNIARWKSAPIVVAALMSMTSIAHAQQPKNKSQHHQHTPPQSKS